MARNTQIVLISEYRGPITTDVIVMRGGDRGHSMNRYEDISAASRLRLVSIVKPRARNTGTSYNYIYDEAQIHYHTGD